MNLKGQIVVHNVFGEGTILEHTGHYLNIEFASVVKKFEYPSAFDGFLEIKDKNITKEIKKEITQAAVEKALLLEKEKKEQAERERRRIEELSYPGRRKKKVYPRYNIAFKCNYCDGGKSTEQIGFNGVCSDEIIHLNIEVEKRAWCSNKKCVCKKYHNRMLARQQLDALCEDEDFVCYESQMLRNWCAKAGGILTGENEGTPMKLNNVQLNSLCVLTTRDPYDSSEEERYIFGVFLIDETFEGNNREEGYVTTKSEFKIKLSPKEAKRMLFWNYHANENKPEAARWGQGLFRYQEDEESAQILRDIAEIKKGTKDEKLAQRFYEHFCTINDVHIETLPEPCGALKIKYR